MLNFSTLSTFIFRLGVLTPISSSSCADAQEGQHSGETKGSERCYGWAALQPSSATYGGKAEWLRDSQPALYGHIAGSQVQNHGFLQPKQFHKCGAALNSKMCVSSQRQRTCPSHSGGDKPISLALRTLFNSGWYTNMCWPVVLFVHLLPLCPVSESFPRLVKWSARKETDSARAQWNKFFF